LRFGAKKQQHKKFTEMDGLTRHEQKILDDVLKTAHENKGNCTDSVTIRGYRVMFRHSRPRWPIDRGNGQEWYETLDIVQIGYEKWTRGQCDFKAVPKRGALFLYRVLESHCIERGIALRIECISDRHLLDYYRLVHGFYHESVSEYSTSVIKPLKAVPKTREEMCRGK